MSLENSKLGTLNKFQKMNWLYQKSPQVVVLLNIEFYSMIILLSTFLFINTVSKATYLLHKSPKSKYPFKAPFLNQIRSEWGVGRWPP
jgi:hypothetical protein